MYVQCSYLSIIDMAERELHQIRPKPRYSGWKTQSVGMLIVETECFYS